MEEFILLLELVLALLCKLLLPLPLVVLKLLVGVSSSAKTSGNVILSCNSSSLKLLILFNPDEPDALLLCSLPPSLPPIVEEEVGLRNVGRCCDIEESCVAVKEPSCCDCGNGGRSFGRLLIIEVSCCTAVLGCVILFLLLRNDEPPSVELSGDVPAGGELRAPPPLSLIDNEVLDVVNVLFDEAV